MLKKANISWNARQLSKMISKGTITFDNAVQRDFVWDDERKSLLIHSMLEGYPIPPMYAAKDSETKNYSMLDGKQRSNAINDFLNGKFTLKNVPEVTLEDGTEVDINGMFFSGLDEEMQDTLSNYSLTIYYFEDITDEQVAELFYRLNNGKALSNIEHIRCTSHSLNTIQKLGSHELFTTSLTEKAFKKYVHEELVIKSYIMLTFDKPCLDKKVVNPTMQNAVLTDEDVNLINSVYDRILNTYKTIIADDSTETGKISKRIAKRVITRTHMLSIMPIVKRSLEENVSDEVFTNWAKNFFCGTKSVTKYEDYNTRCTSGSSSAEVIKVRLKVIKEDYEKFMKEYNKENETVEIADTVENPIITTESVAVNKAEMVEAVEVVDETENKPETEVDTETTETVTAA